MAHPAERSPAGSLKRHGDSSGGGEEESFATRLAPKQPRALCMARHGHEDDGHAVQDHDSTATTRTRGGQWRP
eukprot:2878665-Pyramimonas_sp.AAC.1